MSLLCKVCGNRIKIPTKKPSSFLVRPYISTKYCSLRCQIANYRYILISTGIFFITAYLAISVPLYNNDNDLWILFVAMFPLIFLGLFTLIAGFISLSIFLDIKRKLREKQFYCFYCGYDITYSSREGSLICNSCGNKVLFCNFCSKIINPNEEIAIIKPCNHIFHKGELLDYVEESNMCPKCHGEIKELSFKLDKNDEEFWLKAK